MAFVVCDYFGIDSSDYSFGYITGWQKDKDALETLKQSANRIHKAAKQIIDAIEHQRQPDPHTALAA